MLGLELDFGGCFFYSLSLNSSCYSSYSFCSFVRSFIMVYSTPLHRFFVIGFLYQRYPLLIHLFSIFRSVHCVSYF